MYQKEIEAVEQLISNYFQGIFQGNVELLGQCFQKNTLIYGDIKGQDYLKNVPDYLEGVKNRKNPEDLQESFDMKIIGIDIMGKIAMVKVHVPMLGYNYYDYLSLTKIKGDWKIINKIFTHV